MKEGKACVLFSSPNKNGFTKKILDIFLEGFLGEVATFDLYKENVSPCVDCKYCEKTFVCRNGDNKKILDRAFSSDYIIIASPVYNYSFPSPMKAFLDRLEPYFYKEQKIERKGFLLASAGKSGKFSSDVINKQAGLAFKELGAKFSGSFVLTDTDKEKVITPIKIENIKKASEEFFSV